MKTLRLFVWLPWQHNAPNPAYRCNGWTMHTRTNSITIYGPCQAEPYYRFGGQSRKRFLLLTKAKEAAMARLQRQIRAQLRDVTKDLAELKAKQEKP